VIWVLVLALCVLYLLYLEQLYGVPIVFSNDLLDGYRLVQRHATGSDEVDAQLAVMLQYCQDFIVSTGDRLTQAVSDEQLLPIFSRIASYSHDAAITAVLFGRRASEYFTDRFNSLDLLALRDLVMQHSSAAIDFIYSCFNQGVDHIRQYL